MSLRRRYCDVKIEISGELGAVNPVELERFVESHRITVILPSKVITVTFYEYLFVEPRFKIPKL